MNSNEKQKYRRSKKFKLYKQGLFQYYEYRCSLCGTKHKHGLHCHHKDETAYGQERLEDCVPLCAFCHKWVEYWLQRLAAKKQSFQQNKYTNQIIDVILDFTVGK